ncbi:MAG: hypothetical protein ACRDWD_16095 [Acidimicrobiia bacterium]
MRQARISGFAVLVAMALATAGCILPPGPGPGVPGGPLYIAEPAWGSQLSSVDSVPVRIDLGAVKPNTLRVRFFTGTDFDDKVNVTDRFLIDGQTATATLGPQDFEPGLSGLRVSAVPNGESGARVKATTEFSWEPEIDVDVPKRCEVLGQSKCLLPFPSDHFTVSDPTSDTGRRVKLAPESMPANVTGTHIDPSDWNRNDGFSPGAMILAQVPGIDLDETGAAPITDIGSSLASDAPILLLDADTGERHPFFAELDEIATSDAGRALVIRPARNLLEGHRYIVAMRRLKDTTGARIRPSREFQVYRDEIATFIGPIEHRRKRFDNLLATLENAGIERGNLVLAWDFTVASERNLSERMLHLRDDGFASLGDAAPAFTVTQVTENVDANVLRRVSGTLTVPLYLTGTGAPGSRFAYGPDGLPVRNGNFTANFLCQIPRAAVATDGSVNPARAVVYGHGLLGSRNEVLGFGDAAQAGNIVFCATDWIGMSSADVGNVLQIIQDLSGFPTLADRVQQGILNFQFLARLLKDPDGFASDPAFQVDGEPVHTTGEVFFNGNSQGGIIGGAATAVSTEWTRAVLGVPGMNYSTLLSRSIDFDPFFDIIRQAYPDELDRTIINSLLQMLWDRAEANGYAHHMTDDPLPGTPPHQVLLVMAFGDHQVANITTETEARTIGARVWRPALLPGKSPDVEPQWDIPGVPSPPFPGSVLVIWDFGNPHPPIGNVPPRFPDYGEDPHGKGRDEPRVFEQVSEFLRSNGAFIDVCGGGPCTSDV